jgi:hypothetical protein
MNKIFFLPTARYVRDHTNFASDDDEGPMLGMMDAMKQKADN